MAQPTAQRKVISLKEAAKRLGLHPQTIRRYLADHKTPLEGFKVEWIHFPHGIDHYLKTGEILSEKALEEMGKYRALYVGAIGDPRVAPGVIETEMSRAVRERAGDAVLSRILLRRIGSPADVAGTYTVKIGAQRLLLIADAFNVFNRQSSTWYDYCSDQGFGTTNPNYGYSVNGCNAYSASYQAPFALRLGARFEW